MLKYKLQLLRFSSNTNSTLGALFHFNDDDTNFSKRDFICFTLEDEHRTKKVYGKTRIPAGIYEIKLKKFGGFNDRYKRKFPDLHKGMLCLQDVPNFTDILIHIGNKDDDTAGCILVGDSAEQNITRNGFIGQSTNAYKRIYGLISTKLFNNNQIMLEIIDFDGVVKNVG